MIETVLAIASVTVSAVSLAIVLVNSKYCRRKLIVIERKVDAATDKTGISGFVARENRDWHASRATCSNSASRTADSPSQPQKPDQASEEGDRHGS